VWFFTLWFCLTRVDNLSCHIGSCPPRIRNSLIYTLGIVRQGNNCQTRVNNTLFVFLNRELFVRGTIKPDFYTGNYVKTDLLHWELFDRRIRAVIFYNDKYFEKVKHTHLYICTCGIVGRYSLRLSNL
jgi:hypothetical protein